MPKLWSVLVVVVAELIGAEVRSPSMSLNPIRKKELTYKCTMLLCL